MKEGSSINQSLSTLGLVISALADMSNPAKKKDKIFEAGYGRDHGLGLYLIREILKITNIDIKEKGTPGLGVRFELLVPLCAYRTVNNRDLDP